MSKKTKTMYTLKSLFSNLFFTTLSLFLLPGLFSTATAQSEASYPSQCKQALQNWQPYPNKVDFMVFTCHPDDEGIFFGGALPVYTKVRGKSTIVVSMTGETSNHAGFNRVEELERAAWHYGVRYKPINFQYPDINPTNIADIWDPQRGINGVIDRVATEIRRYKPDVVLTHSFDGEYGHNAHKLTAEVVAKAYDVAADSRVDLSGLPAWQIKKLYIHLYKSPRGTATQPAQLVTDDGFMYHTWETSFPQLGNQSSRQVALQGLECHQDAVRAFNGVPVCSRFVQGEIFDGAHAEDWGLFKTRVGPDRTPNDFFQNIGGQVSICSSLRANAGPDQSHCKFIGGTQRLRASASGGQAPYTYSWNRGLGVGPNKTAGESSTGSFNLTVTDANGCTATDEVTIIIDSNLCTTNTTNSNGISLSFASPTNNATFDSGANLGVVVNASDSNGSIFFVQLAINGRFVRQENGAPYEWGTSNANQTDAALRNLAPGTYTLTATAMDNGGNMQQASIRVTVGGTTTTTGGACAAEAVDNFIYNASTSVNTANGGTGFRGAWNIREAGGNIAFTNGSLGFSGVPTRGNKLTLDPSSSATGIKVFREFSQNLTSNGTLWVSMLMRVNDLTNGGVWLRLNDRQDIAIGKRWANTFGIDNNGSGIPLVNGTTYRLVARYVFNSNSTDIALWINPTNNLNINTPYSTKTVGAISSITGLSLSVEGSSTGSYDIDALTFSCSLPNGLNFRETAQSRNASPTTIIPASAEQFLVYPNPATNNLTVQLPPLLEQNITLDIVNLTGQIVQSANLAIDGQATIQVPLNKAVLSGFYQVLIQVEGQETITKKLVVKRN